MQKTAQGGLANSSGNTLEATIIAALSSKKFATVNYKKYIKNPQQYGEELLLRHVPFQTIYGHNGKSEFVLSSRQYGIRIRIECKWQQSSGSVDEKFPYLFLNCLEAMPEQKIFIVVDGGGAKQGSINWLKKACQEKLYAIGDSKNKEIEVMSLSDFLVWSNKVFR